MKKTLVIIPTYNERDNLEPLLKAIFQVVPEINILIIDDNSPDGTGEFADKLAQSNQQIKVIHRPKKLGLGTAYREGFKAALTMGMDNIIEMDADFSHDPNALPMFLKEIEHYGVVIGSRYCNGISVVNWPLRRLILSLFASFYVRIITGLNLHDTTTGYKCFRREVLEKIDLDKITSQDYAFQIEMNYWAAYLGFKIKEIPIIFVDRHTGTSKMHTGIVNEALLLPWQLRFRSLFGQIPVKKH